MDETTLAIVVLPFIGSMLDGWIYFNSLPQPQLTRHILRSWPNVFCCCCCFLERNDPCFSISPVARNTTSTHMYTVFTESARQVWWQWSTRLYAMCSVMVNGLQIHECTCLWVANHKWQKKVKILSVH